ncbi:hypothetical protein A8B75_19150 [Sphingomonadales bacterium EhC05]|nr:hypothetical protein A8B75_19150 [Sphingomonadales bacterium EhC05]
MSLILLASPKMTIKPNQQKGNTMTKDDTPIAASSGNKSRTRTILAYVGQSAFFILLALAALGFTRQFPQASIQSAPTEIYFVAYGLYVLAALLHFPLVFFRFSSRTKRMVYGGVIGSFIFLAVMSAMVVQAFNQTPEGKRVTAEALAWEKEYAEIKAQNKEQDEFLTNLEDQAASEQKSLDAVEDCFSTFGNRLPDLEALVQERLNNPPSFEHVETTAMSQDNEGRNVQMKFRATNALGGTITSYAYARIYKSTCKMDSVKVAE